MSIGGVALRSGSIIWRLIQFILAAFCVAVFSYFIAILAKHNIHISKSTKAIEGLTALATLYTICASLFTVCLGGNIFFGNLAVVFDLLFMGAFIAIAVMTRSAVHSCSGVVNTPFGTGNVNAPTTAATSNYVPSYYTACRLNKSVFAVSIVLAFLFLLTALWQIMMVRHHRKEKAYGPGPNNDYTAGSGKTAFYKRRGNRRTKEAEAGAIAGTGMRHSHETSTTLGNNNYTPEPKYGEAIPSVPANNYHENRTIGTPYNTTNNGTGYRNTLDSTPGAQVQGHHLYYDSTVTGPTTNTTTTTASRF